MGLALEEQWPFAAKKGITMENTGLRPHTKGKRGRLTCQRYSAMRDRPTSLVVVNLVLSR